VVSRKFYWGGALSKPLYIAHTTISLNILGIQTDYNEWIFEDTVGQLINGSL
jgi:hypothetical protein